MTINYPDYPAQWNPLANDAADSAFRGNPMSVFHKGGRVGTKPISIRVPKNQQAYAQGGLAKQAQQIADAGVGGDELIIHINRNEYEQLKKHWGEPTINPHTGMPQFTPFWKQSWFAPVAALGAAALMATGVGAGLGGALLGTIGLGEAAATGIGAATGLSALGSTSVGTILGNTLIGTGIGGLTGGSKGALMGGLTAGVGTVGSSALSNALQGSTVGNWLGGGDTSSAATGTSGSSGYTAGNPASVGDAGPMNLGVDGSKAASASSGALSGLAKPSFLIPAALLGAAALGGGSPAALPPQAQPGPIDPNLSKRLDVTPLSRQRTDIPEDYYTYGQRKEYTYYNPVEQPQTEQPVVQAAHGGPLSRFVQGGGTGRSDSIDARLSDGEYVMDAETVSLLGDGSSKAGAQRLDQFRANLRRQKGQELSKGRFSQNAKRPEQYLGA